MWNTLKKGIEIVAQEICGKDKQSKKQNWMNSEILEKMEERRECKIRNEEGQYKKLKHEIQKMCQKAKDKYYENKCKEIVMLDQLHSQLLYKKIETCDQ